MKTLTNEQVAKALGWKLVKIQGEKCPSWKKPGTPFVRDCIGTPPFTTSLDAIVAEIEARGLSYRLWRWWCLDKKKFVYEARVGGGYIDKVNTAPMALCLSFLAELKQDKKETK